ncbi:DUF6154 family protein [Bacillus sp. FJAT-49736]|uniref:DUF6154 family protein n=1 Tax=Bacillus sp. FJAT-49736 TaxID=2833582 RepID=UPI001BC9DCC2|nr:DUF6154 family protein [Bacillus sp. FJAT-49736]MBS4173896.1 DUF1836 domain-containing protein [Bacillus sp. FJAT-49736]
MRLVDELFEIYRDKLTGDEEDLDMIALAVVENNNRNELLNIVKEMTDYELHYFVSLYLTETLKEKFAQGTGDLDFLPHSKYLH